jgi:hypothetical protein
MRRLAIVIACALFGLSPLAAATVSGQGTGEWDGVTSFEQVEERDALLRLVGDAGERSIAQRLPLGYRLTLENAENAELLAQVPEVVDAEFMIVVVEEGEFVLNVRPPIALVVDPAVNSIVEYLEVTEEPDGSLLYGDPTGEVVLGSNNEACMDLCTVPPPATEAENAAVQLLKDYSVIGPAKHICFWCLLNDGTGSLLVYPLDDGEFSWLREYNKAKGLASVATAGDSPGSAPASETAPVVMAWAFNPAPGCKRAPGG